MAVVDLYNTQAAIDGKKCLQRLLKVANLKEPAYEKYPVKVKDIKETLIACISNESIEGYFLLNDPDDDFVSNYS